ncbi:unnamed protein product [Cyclocybe aegerita]|uniref:Plasma membrane fusion protein PRM1 n=1 Tax=Cyclocybe aegerita TaxID=1973307 RepID=A0A8S0XP91_CYCAE|nr:unnamed protein product [Cyclocybe aegerita]
MAAATNWNIPPPTYDARSTLATSFMTTTLTPYLQLPHLLSLTWLAYPILSLIFVAFRLQISLADAQDAVASAKDDLIASCKAAEEAATSAASMPRYLALATNKQFADAVNGSMNAARAALVLSLTVMEAIINFIIDLYRSTLLCFLELVVRGGLALIIAAVQEVNQLVQTVTTALRTNIQNDIASANNVIRSAIDAINRVNPFDDITPPQIPVPNLDGLQNVSLPAAFEQALTNLNASLPSVAQLKDKVEDVISTPFELVKKDINDTFAGISFQPELMPVPQRNRLTFCSQLDMSVIDDIGRDFIKAAKIGVVILILVALLLIGLNCLLTWYKWRCLKNHLEYTRQAWSTDPTMLHTKSTSSAPQITLSNHNLMMLNASSEHPLITRITNQISARLRLSPSQHTHMQWFFNYIFHAPALACFLIGFFGLLCVQVQLMAMGPLVAKYKGRAASAVTDFSGTIAESINESMYNQSVLYANEVNGRVDGIQTSINEGVFGWVNGTTTTLNTTINEFYSDIQNAVATVFNGTILESPANEFLRCFIGSKVDAIESALTFLHNNLHVDMPRMNQTVLVLSPESVDEASQPIAAAALGGGEGNDEGLIGRLVLKYAEALKKERVMFAIFLALWGVVILMGLSVVLWHSYGRPYLEKRGRRKYQAEQRLGIGGISPFGVGSNGSTGALRASDEKQREFRSFSPLPSPRRSVFKPFWGSRANSPVGNNSSSPQASVESVGHPAWEAPPPPPQKKSGKLLAIGRKAMGREPKLMRDSTNEELSAPLSPSPPAVQPFETKERTNTNTAWTGKIGALLGRKSHDKDGSKDSSDNDSVDFWDRTAMHDNSKPKPKLHIYTQRGIDKYGPPPRQSQMQKMQEQQATRSRWSASPREAQQPNWMNIMSPTKKTPATTPAPPTVVVSQEPETPSHPPAYSHPPIGLPIRKQQTSDVPLDVGPMYDDPFMSPTQPAHAVLPMPLYNGFESQQQQRRQLPSPPRHPELQNIHSQSQRRRHESSSPPPPPKSPATLQYGTALAPPPRDDRRDRHRRASSMGAQQWRVTNAVPGDSAYSSSATSLVPSTNSRQTLTPKASGDLSITPVTRLLTTTHARRSSGALNPFITPFDDEHRVRIDMPSEAGLRKSVQTNPFTAYAI